MEIEEKRIMLPRYIPWMFHSRNRNLCELSFVVDMNKMLKVLEVLSRYHVKVLYIAGYSFSKEDKINILLFVDVSEVSLDIFQKIISELKKLTKSPIQYTRSRSNDEVFIEELSFPLYADPETRVLLLSADFLANIIKGLYEKYGDVASTILYNFAYCGGEYIVKNFSRRYRFERKEKLIYEMTKLCQATGWCRVEIEELDLDNYYVVLKVYNSFECEALKYRKKPSSHLLRGLFSGIFSAILEKDVYFEEKACIAKDDPYCLFYLKI